MERIENKQVVDWAWNECKEEATLPQESGYIKYGSNEFVPESAAYEYALEHSLNGTEKEQQEFKEMLTEWFFSGNWIRRDS